MAEQSKKNIKLTISTPQSPEQGLSLPLKALDYSFAALQNRVLISEDLFTACYCYHTANLWNVPETLDFSLVVLPKFLAFHWLEIVPGSSRPCMVGSLIVEKINYTY